MTVINQANMKLVAVLRLLTYLSFNKINKAFLKHTETGFEQDKLLE